MDEPTAIANSKERRGGGAGEQVGAHRLGCTE